MAELEFITRGDIQNVNQLVVLDNVVRMIRSFGNAGYDDHVRAVAQGVYLIANDLACTSMRTGVAETYDFMARVLSREMEYYLSRPWVQYLFTRGAGSVSLGLSRQEPDSAFVSISLSSNGTNVNDLADFQKLGYVSGKLILPTPPEVPGSLYTPVLLIA